MGFHAGHVPLAAHLGVGQTASNSLPSRRPNEGWVDCGETAEEAQSIEDSKFGNEKSENCSLADD